MSKQELYSPYQRRKALSDRINREDLEIRAASDNRSISFK